MPQPDNAPIARRTLEIRSAQILVLVLVIASLIVLADGSASGALRSSASFAALPSPAASPTAGPAPEQKARKAAPEPSISPEALALVERMAERQASYPRLESWQARASSTSSRMTSDWKPLSIVKAEKIVSVDSPYWSEEILSATETRGTRTKDITKDAQKEAAERAAKQRRSTPEEREADQRSRGRRSLDMARDEIFPFGPDKRSGYDFTLEGPSELDGAAVVLLRSRSRVRSQEKLDGLYFVDPETYDVRRVEMTLAKRPSVLKRMEVELDFAVLPEGYQMMTKAVMRIQISVVIKNIRVEAVETYTDFRF